MEIKHLTSVNFEEALKSERKVLIDFWASWCGPCKMIAPVLEDIAAENPDFDICKVNVDEEPALAEKFMIKSVPTLVVMKDGVAVAATAGLQPKQAIMKFVSEA